MQPQLISELNLGEAEAFADGSNVAHGANICAYEYPRQAALCADGLGSVRLMSYRLRMETPLAANIRALRKRLQLGQAEFGELFGVSQSTVVRWEKGAEPEYKKLALLAEKAGCTIDELRAEPLSGSKPIPDLAGPTILLPVTLPSAEDMTAMFEALLSGPLKDTDRALLGKELARFLPTALAQLISQRLSGETGPDEAPGPSPGGPTHPKSGPGSRSGRRA